MLNIKFAGIAVAILTIVGAFFAIGSFGVKSPVIASGKLTLDPNLDDLASHADVLFITVFDDVSRSPMPLGAAKIRLSEPAHGDFYEFMLTPERIQLMNPNGELPDVIKLKARLDIDGIGGPDQPGDIFGVIEGVKLGQNDLRIVLDKMVTR